LKFELMLEVNIHQAKSRRSELLRRLIGLDEGLFIVPEDFDAPLPEEIRAILVSSNSRLYAEDVELLNV